MANPLFVQLAQNSGGTTPTTSIQTTITPSAGNLLAYFVSCAETTSISASLSDGVNKWVPVSQNFNATGGGRLDCGYAANVAGVATTITVTFGGSITFPSIAVLEYANLDQGSPFNPSESTFQYQASPGTGVGGVSPGSIQVGTYAALLVGLALDFQDNIPATPAVSGMIERGPIWSFTAAGNSTSVVDMPVTAPGVLTPAWTASVNHQFFSIAMVLHANAALPQSRTQFFSEDRLVRT